MTTLSSNAQTSDSPIVITFSHTKQREMFTNSKVYGLTSESVLVSSKANIINAANNRPTSSCTYG